jgi:glycosyltransferase involved in cell wall biosynthesis
MTVFYGMLSTYPPTQCGLATFSQALLTALESPHDSVGVVRVVDPHELRPEHRGPGHPGAGRPTDAVWVRGTTEGAVRAAHSLNTFDVAVLQHEYGIFPGADGSDVLEVVRCLDVPLVTVLHTVLVTPSPHQREILEKLVAASSAVVTMTRTARDRLVAHYGVDAGHVTVIPHGADPVPSPARRSERRPGDAPVVLTWGLLGEGKGIEWAIDAMALLTDLQPRPQYRVVGQTHPKVKARHGESYRQHLVERAARGGSGAVTFDDRYLTNPQLHAMVQEADVVLLPYDSREQVTSGVLIEAVAAGKPVVSTAFPHAVELLSSGAGLLVDRQDPVAIAAALRSLFTDSGLASRMAAEAERLAPHLLWPAVADRYRRLARQLIPPPRVLARA